MQIIKILLVLNKKLFTIYEFIDLTIEFKKYLIFKNIFRISESNNYNINLYFVVN